MTDAAGEGIESSEASMIAAVSSPSSMARRVRTACTFDRRRRRANRAEYATRGVEILRARVQLANSRRAAPLIRTADTLGLRPRPTRFRDTLTTNSTVVCARAPLSHVLMYRPIRQKAGNPAPAVL